MFYNIDFYYIENIETDECNNVYAVWNEEIGTQFSLVLIIYILCAVNYVCQERQRSSLIYGDYLTLERNFESTHTTHVRFISQQ